MGGEITGRKPRVTADRANRGPPQAKPAKKVADKGRESKAQQQGDDVSESESATAANGGTTAANEGGSAANGDAEHEPTPHGEPQSGAPNKLPPIRGPPIPVAAYSITEFCQAHRLSESMYFKLRNQGLGPDEMSVGSRRIISFEAAERWRRERERGTATASTSVK